MTVIGHGYDDNVGAPAFRNMIINGGMSVAQRATSVASITTSGYYTVDRWNMAINTLGTWTQSVENDAPTGTGLRKSTKLLCTTADTSPAAADFFLFAQYLEGQDCQRIAKGTANAKQLTISFWVKSNKTGTYIVEIEDQDNTRYCAQSYTINASATWELKQLTFPADTTGVLDNDNAASIRVNFWLSTGSNFSSGTLGTTWQTTQANRGVGQTNLAAAINNYWQITGVQLEAGSVATPFEFEPFETTLRKCQRYFQKSCADGVSLGRSDSDSSRHSGWVMGTSSSTIGGAVTVWHQVPMRTIPTMSFAAWDTGPTTVAVNGTFSVHCNSQGNVTGSYVYSNNRKFVVNTSAINGMFFFTYEANAEL